MIFRHLVAMFAGTVAISATSFAADVSDRLPGQSFALSGACAASVTIEPGAADFVAVKLHADHPEEIERLRFEVASGGPVLHPRAPNAPCWRPEGSDGFRPTLHVAVEVPRGASLALDDDGVSHDEVGDVGGRLVADLSGGVTLDAARATSVSLDLSGNVAVSIADVSGAATLDGSGQTTVRIARIAASSLHLDLSGASGFTAEAGSIGALDADVSGASQVAIGATTGPASIDASGSSHVRLAHPTGPIERDVSGAASIDTGG